MTPAMRVQGACLQYFLSFLVGVLATSAPVGAQALRLDTLGNGTALVFVAEPLADATTVVWPSPDGGVTEVSSGDLTLTADVESALAAEGDVPPPAVVVAVGGVAFDDLHNLLDRVFLDRLPAALPERGNETLTEGVVERRLGSPGSDAEIRVEVDLPPPEQPTRSAVEVLWSLLPELLANDLTGVRSRMQGDRGLIEARTAPENADIDLRRLRLGLARIADNPALKAGAVEAAALRLSVRRQAFLEQHPEAAARLLELWLGGRGDAVREFLFGVDGVTLETVRIAALRWLPQHPGNTVVMLPPRVFNPRFAAPPQMLQMENGLTAAILERTGTPLSVISLRPVVVPNLDEELAATILTRLAGELRTGRVPPGWIWVDARPPQLEVAAPADAFGELSEALYEAYDTVASDQRPLGEETASARRRALRLMGGVLGVAEGTTLSPAELLRVGNLALGAVAADGETAAEALRKFWSAGERAGGAANSTAVAPVPRTREAAPGGESVLVVDLELGYAADEALLLVVAELVEARAEEAFPECAIEVLRPFVPGHRTLLLVATAQDTVEAVEDRLRASWKKVTTAAGDEELAAARRQVAARNATAFSGVTGRARYGAAVAVGEVAWRPVSELELRILSVPAEAVSDALAGFVTWEDLVTTGAGMLPIAEPGAR